MRRLRDLFRYVFSENPDSVEKLAAGGGSDRSYYRLRGGGGVTAVGVVGTSKEENAAFIYLSNHFAGKNLPVPRVLGTSPDGMCYLQQDLGDCTLYGELARGRNAGGVYDERETELLRRTVRLLPEIQIRGDRGLDYSVCYPSAEFDRQSIFFDLNYFKYSFLKLSGTEFNETRLEESFRLLAADLEKETLRGFMYRDFQARNVMLRGGNPYFIDFQGGRRGPCYYDAASFLWQASARYGAELRSLLAGEYYDALSALRTDIPERKAFDVRLKVFVLFRLLQVLGAYGFRGLIEGKPYFENSIPPALDNLRELLEENDFPFGYLTDILRGVIRGGRFSGIRERRESLVVRVFSFSYKRGIPRDESGNGGGYVFDCRSSNNPGRKAEFRNMTGLDAPVRKFIEDDGELPVFLESVRPLADKHVERWLERGFTDLMFSFGCTGGQHRSVYSAEWLARHLNGKYGVEVRLCHREIGVNRVLPGKKGGRL